MDVRLPADIAARRFEREHAEAARHKPHVFAPEGIAADVASEADGQVSRPKRKNPRDERKGKPAHSFQAHTPPFDASASDSG